jgi:hypothetical protein
MIVFSLSCKQQHTFDGWFRSSDDFDAQTRMGLVECPVCGDGQITKQLSAPRINTGASESASASAKQADLQADARPDGPQEVVAASMMPDLQQHMLKQFKQFVMANTENVGSNFAETARRIHYGEEAHRNIRGRVSPEDAVGLREEGIDVVPLPPGVRLDEGVQ